MRMIIRPLGDTDSLEELTLLLHSSYARLATMGLNYVATNQSVQVTRDRIEGCDCFVAVAEDRLVGTITYRPPERTAGSPWFDRPDVASLGQFAVEPALQGSGIGRALFSQAENHARNMRVPELAGDTAEPATHLVNLYLRWGYRIVERMRWPHATYESVVFSKMLQ